jgi:hypothetical protein
MHPCPRTTCSTASARRSGSARRRAALLLVAAVLTGCAVTDGRVGTRRSLERANLPVSSVSLAEVDGQTVLDVSYQTAGTSPEHLAALQRLVEDVVWRQAPVRFDLLRMTALVRHPEVARNDTATVTRQQLLDRLGPRPPSLDRGHTRAFVLLAAAAVVAVVGSLVGATVLVVLISRRRARAEAA